MACLLGIAQASLTLLSLRCAIANRFMNFCNLRGHVDVYENLPTACGWRGGRQGVA